MYLYHAQNLERFGYYSGLWNKANSESDSVIRPIDAQSEVFGHAALLGLACSYLQDRKSQFKPLVISSSIIRIQYYDNSHKNEVKITLYLAQLEWGGSSISMLYYRARTT